MMTLQRRHLILSLLVDAARSIGRESESHKAVTFIPRKELYLKAMELNDGVTSKELDEVAYMSVGYAVSES